MGRVYAIASAKGGVGKTTTTAALGGTLAAAGHRVAVVDADVGMPNLGRLLGVSPDGPTLHDVLAGEADPLDAVYEGPDGLAVVPGSPSLDAYARADPRGLDGVLDALADYDVVLVDTGAGLSHDTLFPLGLADAVLLVSTPATDALGDTEKTNQLAARVDVPVAGLVLTRVDTARVDVEAAAAAVDADLLAVVPEDPVLGTETGGDPPATLDPDTPAAAAYRVLADAVAADAMGDAFDEAAVAVETREAAAAAAAAVDERPLDSDDADDADDVEDVTTGDVDDADDVEDVTTGDVDDADDVEDVTTGDAGEAERDADADESVSAGSDHDAPTADVDDLDVSSLIEDSPDDVDDLDVSSLFDDDGPGSADSDGVDDLTSLVEEAASEAGAGDDDADDVDSSADTDAPSVDSDDADTTDEPDADADVDADAGSEAGSSPSETDEDAETERRGGGGGIASALADAEGTVGAGDETDVVDPERDAADPVDPVDDGSVAGVVAEAEPDADSDVTFDTAPPDDRDVTISPEGTTDIPDAEAGAAAAANEHETADDATDRDGDGADADADVAADADGPDAAGDDTEADADSTGDADDTGTDAEDGPDEKKGLFRRFFS
jgi:septum site-determining protein MinD